MARKRNNLVAVLAASPAMVTVATLALWQNEGRFDYHQEARDAQVVAAPLEAPPDRAVSITGALDTAIPIEGRYVDRFVGFHVVRRHAEIYSWERDEDSEGDVTWTLGWYSSVDSNSRNSGLRQRLRGAREMYPPLYRLEGMPISRSEIHLVDPYGAVPIAPLELSEEGRRAGLRRVGGYFYLGASPTDPDLGDERLSFSGIPNREEATYFGFVERGRGVGRQMVAVDGFVASLIQNDGILHHLANGGRAEALETLRADFERTKWMVRVGGTLGIVLGLALFFQRFASLVSGFGPFRSVLRVGAGLLALALGVPFALTVIFASMAAHLSMAALLPLLLFGGVLVYFAKRARGTSRRVDAALQERLATRAPRADVSQPAGPRDVLEETFAHLAALALVEGGLDRREAKFLIRWGKRNGIPGARMRTLMTEAREAAGPVEAASIEDLQILVYLALSDGVLSSRELRVLRGVAHKLGFEPGDLERIVAEAEAQPAAA